MREALVRHRPATLTQLPLLVAHAAPCLAAVPHKSRLHALRNPDRAFAATAAAARKPSAASAAADRACIAAEMAPLERQPGEWESPITSQLITSAVRTTQSWCEALCLS